MPLRIPARMPARVSAGTTGNAARVATPERNPDAGLSAASLGISHFLLINRASVLAELLFEFEVGAGR